MCRAMALLRWRFVLVVYLFLDAATAMFNKRSKGYDASDISPSKRLRCNLADLFLSNTIPGDRTQSLFDDAAAASARGGFENLQSRNDIDRNAHRNLLRKLLKNCKWPPPYLVKVRIWNNTTQKPDTCWVPVLLPHEVLHAIMLRSNKQALCDKDGMSAAARRHLEQACQQNPQDAQSLNNLAVLLDTEPPVDQVRALELVTAALALDPRNTMYRETRGQILLRLQRYAEAVTDLEYALNGLGDQPKIHAALATAYDKLGQVEVARMHRQQADGR